jgi:membrane protein required for colicin V production
MLIDIVFLGLMVSAAIKGFHRGLVMAVFSLLAFVIGLAAALKLSATVAAMIQDSTGQASRWWPFVAFLVVMLAVGAVIRLAGRMLEKTLEFAMLGWVNSVGGFLVFAVLHTLLYSILLFFMDRLHLLPASVKNASVVLPWIEPWGTWTMDMIGRWLPAMRNVFEDLQGFFGDVDAKIKS